MKITIDTDKELIIVPDTYYANIDKMNKNIELGGGTPVDYTDYVKKSFEAAIANPMKRKSDK